MRGACLLVSALSLIADTGCNRGDRTPLRSIAIEPVAATNRLLSAYNQGCSGVLDQIPLADCERIYAVLGRWQTLAIQDQPHAGRIAELKGRVVFQKGAFRFLALWDTKAAKLLYLLIGDPWNGGVEFPNTLVPQPSEWQPQLIDPPPLPRNPIRGSSYTTPGTSPPSRTA